MDRRMMRGISRNQRPARAKKFIYDLPHGEFKDIEDMLNMNETWETLAGEHLQLKVGEIDKMRRYNNMMNGNSAAKALLDYLSNRNTTIQDLFMLLQKVELYRGMDIIKSYVPEKYHHLIKSGPSMTSSMNGQNTYTPPQPVAAKLMPQFNVEETASQNIPDMTGLRDSSTARMISGAGQDITGSERSYASVERHRHRHLSDLRDIERQRHLSETRTEAGSISSGSSMASVGVQVISYEEIASACDHWNPALKLGEGGFGQVFKGIWKHQEVAIKTIKRDKYLVNEDKEHRDKSIAQCFKEINILNRVKSQFIVPIIAQSVAQFGDTEEPCIVYQWMPNGSLDDRLQKKKGSPALTWVQRYNIGMGVANGIQFLHTHNLDTQGQGDQLVHGDIKSANILLDKNFEPKIGDFGLAREVEGGKSKYFFLSTIYGTQFYLPQDFLRSKRLTPSVDTYSFGVIMFDLVTGKRPQTKIGKEYLLDIMRDSDSIPSDHVDTSWHDHFVDSHLCKILYNIGKQCTAERAKSRPKMEEVYKTFKSALRAEATSPSPYEIQQRFDSINKAGPKMTKCDGFVVNDNVNLIDLSSSEVQSDATITSSQSQGSFMIPSTITQEQSQPVGPTDSSQLSNFLPAVISEALPSSDIPVVVHTDLSSSSTLSATNTLSVSNNCTEESLESIERDIEQSAQLLSDLGF